MTPVDPIDISNLALALFGAEANLVSFNDNTKASRLCSKFYDMSRQSALAMHPWKFAEHKAWVTDLHYPPPAFRWTYAYDLPDDCIAVRLVNDNDSEWEISGRTIQCNYYTQVTPPDPSIQSSSSGPADYLVGPPPPPADGVTGINLIYTRDIQNYYHFHPLFVDVLAMVLASKIVFSMTQSDERTQSIMKQLEGMQKAARFRDAVQNSPKKLIADYYEEVRIGPNRGFVRDPMT